MAKPPDGVPRQRTYYIDWLRIVAVFLLVPYHTAMIFVPWGYHIKNAETTVVLEVFNRFIKPDGNPAYNQATAFAVVHYAINLFQIDATRGRALLEDLAAQLSEDTGEAQAFRALHRFVVLAQLGEDSTALDALEQGYEQGFTGDWVLALYLDGMDLLKDNTRLNAIRQKIQQRNQATLEYIQQREAEDPSLPANSI